MHIIVCIKSVPDTTVVEVNPEDNTLRRDQVGSQINPFDLYAIEEAIRLREIHGGSVTVLSMGPQAAEKELREALAIGCDAAVLLSSRAFAGSDTWATAYTLALAIQQLAPYDLVICGRQAIDGDTGQVGPGIAAHLGIVQLTYVSRISALDTAAGSIRVERLLEEGVEVVEAQLPTLLTVLKDINQPRFPTPRSLRRAQRAEVAIWGPDQLPGHDPALFGLDGSPTRVVTIDPPPERQVALRVMPGNDVAEQCANLIAALAAERLI
ncbi:MAG: electron transfer flavoprotein subunit beta/FixA family protein [Chloroflexi bacterium]|nr:electron transfer flavoprotein subunit beta/FixA family protein [Chloroflexota bacterium]